MKIIPNAGEIAWRAYSMWANYLGIACLIAPEVIYAVWEVDTNPRLWWFLGLGLILAGIVGRLIQQGVDDDVFMRSSPPAVLIAMLVAMSQIPASQPAEANGYPYTDAQFNAVAVPLIAKWEGAHKCKDDPAIHCAYLDTIAEPDLPTVCYGETRGVTMGMRFTERQCRDMLARAVGDFRAGLHGYFTPETIKGRLTPHRDAAYTSLAYNAGQRAIGRSTATRRLNAGNIRGGCKALTWWNKAGKKVIRGLVRRRAEEYKLCMIGVSA